MRKQGITILLLAILLLSIIRVSAVQAQDGGWSKPYRLSTEAGRASPAFLVSDQYGYVHGFWTETLFDDQRTIFQYTRFDGVTWTAPNDFYITDGSIEDMAAVVDQHGKLHVVWTEGTSGPGPVYYTVAPAENAQMAQNWAQPLQIDIPAGVIRFEIDSKDVFHILYVNRIEQGVYYLRSGGMVRWINPSPTGFAILILSMEAIPGQNPFFWIDITSRVVTT
jgi:hypothetical protein